MPQPYEFDLLHADGIRHADLDAGVRVLNELIFECQRSLEGTEHASHQRSCQTRRYSAPTPEKTPLQGQGRRSGNRFWSPGDGSTLLTSRPSVRKWLRKCRWPGYRYSSYISNKLAFLSWVVQLPLTRGLAVRLVVGAVVMLICGVANGQQKKESFELPFAQTPPPAVSKIMQDALRDLNKDTKQIFAEVEKQLNKELERQQENKKLAEANFTQATMSVCRSWLLRQTLYDNVPSPVGKWKKSADPKFAMTINADGTITPSWHTGGCLWNQDGIGNVRMIHHAGNRGVHEFALDESGDTLTQRLGGETWIRDKP
jgi:hypothetical protein